MRVCRSTDWEVRSLAMYRHSVVVRIPTHCARSRHSGHWTLDVKICARLRNRGEQDVLIALGYVRVVENWSKNDIFLEFSVRLKLDLLWGVGPKLRPFLEFLNSRVADLDQNRTGSETHKLTTDRKQTEIGPKLEFGARPFLDPGPRPGPKSDPNWTFSGPGFWPQTQIGPKSDRIWTFQLFSRVSTFAFGMQT